MAPGELGAVDVEQDVRVRHSALGLLRLQLRETPAILVGLALRHLCFLFA
jgi:hypothetical protein